MYNYGPSHMNGGHSHTGRNRRAPRTTSAAQNRQFRQPRTPVVEQPPLTHLVSYRRDYLAAKSFDIEDDELFCPFHLLTADDLQSIHSSGSDRSSLSSGSPECSPTQHSLAPTPACVLSAVPNPYTPASFQSNNSSQTKIHQPLAQRNRHANAIAIVNPETRASVSPSRQMQQQFQPRW
jgi:hypothetical protein